MRKGDEKVILFPNFRFNLSSKYVGKLMAHFETCKDICDDFGTYTIMYPKPSDEKTKENHDYEGFVIESYKDSQADAYIRGDDKTGLQIYTR